jgi:hypothetical protein
MDFTRRAYTHVRGRPRYAICVKCLWGESTARNAHHRDTEGTENPQRRPGPQQVTLWLRRSRRFIDPTINPWDLRSSGARCFRQRYVTHILRFAPLERGGVFVRRAVYKHFVPTGRGKWLEQSCQKNKKLDLCYTARPKPQPNPWLIWTTSSPHV